MLRTAADLFLEKGYDQTSVDEVIQRAGGSKTHIYREFGGKEGLFLAAVKYLCAEVQQPIETLDVSGLPFEAGLLQLSQALVRMLLAERHLALQRLVFAEASRFQKTGEIWFAGGPEVTHGIFSRFFAQAMQAGAAAAGGSGSDRTALLRHAIGAHSRSGVAGDRGEAVAGGGQADDRCGDRSVSDGIRGGAAGVGAHPTAFLKLKYARFMFPPVRM